MKPPSKGSSLFLGILTMVGIAALGLVVLVLSVVSFGTKEYTATLEHTAGLRKGEAVLIAGVDVGKVIDTDLEGNSVVVTFTLDKDVRLGRDTTAAVKVATLLGTHYLEVEPLGSGELSDEGIDREHTSVPYNLQDVIDAGTRGIDALDTDKLAQALAQVRQVLQASGQDMGPALDGIDRLSRAVVGRSDEFGALIKASRTVSDQLSASSSDVVHLMQQSNLVIEELNVRRQVIDELLKDVRQLSVTLSGLVADNRATLKPALDRLDVVLEILKQRKKELAIVVDKVGVSGRYLANAFGTGPWAELYAPDALPDTVYCRTHEGCR